MAVRAGCSPLPGDARLDLPGGLGIACAGGTCTAVVAGVRLGDVRVGPGATICDVTHLRTEAALPATCDAAVRRTGASIRQDRPGSGGSEVVIDVLEPARGIPWVGPQRPLRACLPRYAEKRGDVWQRTWRGEAKDLLFQVFEEDESRQGRGNSAPRARAVPPVVSTTALTEPPPAARVPVRRAPAARAEPDADRF